MKTEDWHRLAQVRGAIERAVLKERQRRVLDIVVKATLVRGRLSVRVPRLAEFEHLIGVTKGNLSVIFRELQRARILQVRALAEGGMEIVVLPDARNWDVVWRYERSDLQSFLLGLDAFTGQVQGELLPPDPSLWLALAEVSAESSVPDLGTIPFPIWERVPDLGTAPVPNLGTNLVPNLGTNLVPNLGTGPPGPSNKAAEAVVPNLGTNSFDPVPKSGTAPLGVGGNVSGNVYSLNVKRLNVSETFAGAREAFPNRERPDPETLKLQVREFVGETDWQEPKLWNGGNGWQGRLFTEEGAELASALHYCKNGIQTGEVRLKKTRGALLWDAFQRKRQERDASPALAP